MASLGRIGGSSNSRVWPLISRIGEAVGLSTEGRIVGKLGPAADGIPAAVSILRAPGEGIARV